MNSKFLVLNFKILVVNSKNKTWSFFNLAWKCGTSTKNLLDDEELIEKIKTNNICDSFIHVMVKWCVKEYLEYNELNELIIWQFIFGSSKSYHFIVDLESMANSSITVPSIGRKGSKYLYRIPCKRIN